MKLKEFNFEVYTINPETGESGWDIKFVSVIAQTKVLAKEYLKKWKLFDCIILFEYEIDASVAEPKEGQIWDTLNYRNQETDQYVLLTTIE